ncbi:universal stress protein, partial [Actinomadura bangladeshensis]
MSDVVVGYDGSGESELALRWAVEEALLRRLPLTVCH